MKPLYASGDLRWQRLYTDKIRDSNSLKTHDIEGNNH